MTDYLTDDHRDTLHAFDAAEEARDKVGYSGTPAQCITDQNTRIEKLEGIIRKAYETVQQYKHCKTREDRLLVMLNPEQL